MCLASFFYKGRNTQFSIIPFCFRDFGLSEGELWNLTIWHQSHIDPGMTKQVMSTKIVNEEGMLFMAHISIDSIWGATPLATMKSRGEVMGKDVIIIPVVEELFELQGSSVFSKLDLKCGYSQMRVHKGDIPNAAF